MFSTNLTAQSKVDSLKTFTPTQVRRIANMIIKNHECDALLSTTTTQLSVYQGITQGQQAQLVFLKQENADRDSIVNNKAAQIQELTKVLKVTTRRLKWTKFGWISTTILLTGLLMYSVVK